MSQATSQWLCKVVALNLEVLANICYSLSTCFLSTHQYVIDIPLQEGMLQHYELGEYFRNRYIDGNPYRLLDANYSRYQVSITLLFDTIN